MKTIFGWKNDELPSEEFVTEIISNNEIKFTNEKGKTFTITGENVSDCADVRVIKELPQIVQILDYIRYIKDHETAFIFCGPEQGKPWGDRELETKEEKQRFLDWLKENLPEVYHSLTVEDYKSMRKNGISPKGSKIPTEEEAFNNCYNMNRHCLERYIRDVVEKISKRFCDYKFDYQKFLNELKQVEKLK